MFGRINTEYLTTVCALCFFVALLLLNTWITYKESWCQDGSFILEEVFAYDRDEKPIRRREAAIAGGLRTQPVFLLIGIPTVFREYKNNTVFYLPRTLKALINPLTKKEKETMQILIILADRDNKKRKYIYEQVTALFGEELKNGLINVIGIPDRFYLQLHDLPRTYGDSARRLYWRSKQSLDYAYIFNYAHNLCQYYMQIEDDVIAEYDYYHVIRQDIKEHNEKTIDESRDLLPWEDKQAKQPWMVLEYYKLGFIGRLIPSFYLPMLSTFVRTFYNEMPVDWLYPHLAGMMGIPAAKLEHSLFTHIGKQSSSAGT